MNTVVAVVDEVTDEEMDALVAADLVFECQEHGILETVETDEVVLLLSILRRNQK